MDGAGGREGVMALTFPALWMCLDWWLFELMGIPLVAVRSSPT